MTSVKISPVVRNKRIARRVMRLICEIDDGAIPGASLQLFLNDMAQVITHDMLRRYRARQDGVEGIPAMPGHDEAEQASGGQEKGR